MTSKDSAREGVLDIQELSDRLVADGAEPQEGGLVFCEYGVGEVLSGNLSPARFLTMLLQDVGFLTDEEDYDLWCMINDGEHGVAVALAVEYLGWTEGA